MSYTPPIATLSPSWEGADGYIRPVAWLTGSWAQGAIYPAPFESTKWGETFVTKQQFLDPAGWGSSTFPTLSLRVTLDWEYPPPFSEVNASWVGKAAYTPPSGANLQAQWVMGSGSAEEQFADPTGFDAVGVGAARIRNAFEAVNPPGFAALQTGQPTIYNLDRYLPLGGIPSKLAFGSTKIENRDRYLTPAGKYSTLFGTAFMQGGVTQVLVSGIAPPAITQKPWASFSPRWIEAGDLKAPGVSMPLVGGTRYLEPEGYEATLWGERIVPESQTIYPQGQVLSLWGDAKPWNYTTWVSPLAIKWQAEELRFGTTTAWNLRQIVQHRHDIEHTDAFGVWTGIENRNRVITHHSTAPGLLPAPQVENAARPLLAAPIAPPAVPLTGMISHGVRSYQLDGIEPPLLSRWLSVHNDAKLVQPAGFAATTFGDNRPTNNRRYFPYITAGDQQIIGTPMVADAIRTVVQDSRYAITPPLVQLPWVKLRTRYIEPPGLDGARYGGHHFHIHWTLIAPRWIHNELTGEASVRNVTPEVRTHGRDSAEFGDSAIRTQWRRVEASGLSAQVFGLSKIADRRQRVYPPGIHGLMVGAKLKVERTGVYIPEQQYVTQVDPHGYHEITLEPVPYGSTHGMGKPVMNLQLAYPEGFSALAVGDVRVTANSIRPDPGYINYKAFGEHMVSLKKRVVDVTEGGIGWANDVERYGKPRLSPHTIWAVVEAPGQAKENHPSPNLHYVDQNPVSGVFIKGLGRPSVSLSFNTVRTHGYEFGTTGQPSVELKDRRVYPPGMPLLKMGWNALFGSVRYIRPRHKVPGVDDLNAPDQNPEIFGGVTVTRRWTGPQGVVVEGISGNVPAPRIEHFHRTIAPAGVASLSMGSSRGEPPYAWQSLHVGPPMPTRPHGFSAEFFGTAWVSLKIRDIFVPGADHFISEYDFRDFALRMRVLNRPTAGPATQGVAVLGFNAFDSLPSNVSNWVQYIRPDGNMDNYRKGAPQ